MSDTGWDEFFRHLRYIREDTRSVDDPDLRRAFDQVRYALSCLAERVRE